MESTSWIHFLFEWGSYPAVSLLVILTIYYGLKLHPPHDIWQSVMAHRWIWFTSLFITISIFATHDWAFRLFADETNLLSVSKSLFESKRAVNLIEAEWNGNRLEPIHWIVDKRPVLFSFTTHVLHYLLGFQWWNGFVVNAILLFLFLGFTGVVFSRADHRNSGRLSWAIFVFSLLAHPFVIVSVVSSGFDFLALVVLVFALFATFSSESRPPSDPQLKWALLWLLLLIHTRYEMILLAGLVFMYLLYRKQLTPSFLRRHVSFLFLLFLILLPHFAQRLLAAGTYENPPNTALFSIQNIAEHLSAFWFAHQLSPFHSPVSFISSFASLVALTLFFIHLFKQQAQKASTPIRHDWFIVFLWSIHLTVVLCHLDSRLDHPAQSRYFLATFAGLSFMLAIVSIRIQHLRVPLLVMSGLAFLVSYPSTFAQPFFKKLTLNHEIHQILSHLQPADTDSKRELLIYDRPGIFVAQNRASVHFSTAQRNGRKILHQLKNGLLNRVLIVQRLDRSGTLPLDGYSVHSEWTLHPVQRFQSADTEWIRISELVNAQAPN